MRSVEKKKEKKGKTIESPTRKSQRVKEDQLKANQNKIASTPPAVTES